MTDVTVNTLAPPFVALSKSQAVFGDAASALTSTPRRRNWPGRGRLGQVSPSLVQVTSRAPTADVAIQLSNAMVSARWTSATSTCGSTGSPRTRRICRIRPPTRRRRWLAWTRIRRVTWFCTPTSNRSWPRAAAAGPPRPPGIVLLSQPGVADKVAPLPLRQTGGLPRQPVDPGRAVRIPQRPDRAAHQHGLGAPRAHRHGYSVVSADRGASDWPLDTQVLLNTVGGHGRVCCCCARRPRRPRVYVGEAVSRDRSGGGVEVRSVGSDWWRDPGPASTAGHRGDRRPRTRSQRLDGSLCRTGSLRYPGTAGGAR